VFGDRALAGRLKDSQRMTNALIAFATRHGQTERIALRIAKVLVDAGTTVDLVDLGRTRRTPAIDAYRLVIVAGPVHFGKHPRSLERFVRRNRAALDAVESVLVSVSNAAISVEGEKEAERTIAELTRRTGWKPRRTLLAAGAIRYTEYNLFMRWMMRRIAATHGRGTDTSRDYEYTYWPEVEEFAHALLPAVEEIDEPLSQTR
jgi:menaquinone-dependent protoporphyrinogen oxidase